MWKSVFKFYVVYIVETLLIDEVSALSENFPSGRTFLPQSDVWSHAGWWKAEQVSSRNWMGEWTIDQL